MVTDDRRDSPLLNPVLSLRKEPAPETVQGGGRGAGAIVTARLGQQRQRLSASLRGLVSDPSRYKAHGGRVHLVAKMFADSLAPSYKPSGLFEHPRIGCRLVAPTHGGYLVEADTSRLEELAGFAQSTEMIEAQVAISRVETIEPFGEKALLHGLTKDALWDAAADVEGGKAFIVWFAPFRNETARNSVIQTMARLESERIFLPSYPGLALTSQQESEDADEQVAVPMVRPDQTGLARAMRRYRDQQVAKTFVTVPSKNALVQLIASGASFRLDPVRRIEVTAPGEGAEPPPPVPNANAQPIVMVVDGGLTANSYKPLEVWRMSPPLIKDRVADHPHGNRVTSLVVHGHAWNNLLDIPPLECRVATVQAVPRQGANVAANPEQLVEYLRHVARAFPEARVWNMSFNQTEPELDTETVSYLGHEIASLARKAGVLPVISIGNRSAANAERLCAPADCEAALTVGGRAHDDDGKPAGNCPVSLKGPGPDGMLKPDVSWYSHLRMLGGGRDTGSSYATALVSSLAAHTFANLKDPSPDLVRALIINATEQEQHDVALGGGSPNHIHMPWACEPGTVTLAWRAKLRPGYAYYWNDIPIPPELVRNGKLYGKGRLTAILDPVLSDLAGPNYFATRLQVALQYQTGAGKWDNLLGSMKESRIKEPDARADLAKWHPVRRHSRDFNKRGVGFSGDTFRLHARVYTRDLFQFDIPNHHEMGEQEVSFVLTLSDGSTSPAIYNSTAQRLSTFVESAVIGQEIEIHR